jgi:hypothetical protein
MATRTLRVNRAPVLTLWAAVVAERLGHDRDAALTLGKAVAGMNAQSKGQRLGIYHETEPKTPRPRVQRVELLGRRVPVKRTKAGLRAVRDGAAESPATVERYLESKLGAALPDVRAAMTALAASLPAEELAERAYALYEAFRPAVPAGERGWGAQGKLDLDKLRTLQKRPSG